MSRKAATTQSNPINKTYWEIAKADYKAIRLQNLKVHDAFNIKGVVSGYWNVKSKQVQGLELTLYPEVSLVELVAPGVKPIMIPLTNIPFFSVLEEEKEAVVDTLEAV